ncbi:SLC13 family permease [Nocardioides sp. AE5]|uniref:SLC13 family permease n=1 Tax=Nocardioides sp. AE5 TaxID=2962573 RepID=UPI00288168A6|nr:SLC13 family permease [Nocardioides sp. AE5]MDT0201577.1 ArsB/NhaD family transporter [Nocardioides sp. AE5]
MPAPLLDLIVVSCLAGALAIALAHPRGRWEALVALGASAVVIGTGVISIREATDQVRLLLPVVGFLVAILVVADACAAAGLFRALGALVRRHRGDGPRPLVLLSFIAAAVVTAVLSLDATVVLLTPVIAAATIGTTAHRAGVHANVRLANSASLLLPVSNLTNLLALPHLGISFTTWLLLMAPVWLAVLAVEYAGMVLVFSEVRRGGASGSVGVVAAVRLPRFPLLAVAVMLVGFAAGSPLGIDPVWVAAGAAMVLVLHGTHAGTLDTRRVLDAAHLPFALFVLGLGVVVLGVTDSFLGSLVAALVPHGKGLPTLLLIALLATLLANVVNNLPATLLLVPLVAPLGPAYVLAALIGLNVGSGLTLPGSLANLLWRRTLLRHGLTADLRLFHRHAILVTPVAVLAGVLVLWMMTGIPGLLHA